MVKLRPENEHLLEEARGDVYGAESQESVVMMLAELRQENQTLKNLLDHSSFFQQFMAQEDVSVVKEHDEEQPEDEIKVNYHVSEENPDYDND